MQHFLWEHLKLSEVPFMCNQCPFRAHTRRVMVDHRRGEHQALQGKDLYQICYGTLKPMREEEIFRLLPVLHRPEAENKGEERPKGAGELEVIVGLPMKRGAVGKEARGGPKSPCPSASAQWGGPCPRGGSRTQLCHRRMQMGRW